MSAWDAALRSLPKLLSLTFDFEQDSNVSMIRGEFDDSMLEREMLVNDSLIGDEIAASAAAWTDLVQPSLSRKAEAWEYQPNLNKRPVTQYVFSESTFPLSDHISSLVAFLRSVYIVDLFRGNTDSEIVIQCIHSHRRSHASAAATVLPNYTSAYIQMLIRAKRHGPSDQIL